MDQIIKDTLTENMNQAKNELNQALSHRNRLEQMIQENTETIARLDKRVNVFQSALKEATGQ